MNPESSEDQLDRAQSEIRTDADAARRRAPLPQREALVRVTQASAPRSSIAELARHNGRAFVENAYRSILERTPDEPGMERQMAALAAGTNKVELIGDLRYSAEGRRIGRDIPGLFPRYFLAKLGRVPVLGALWRWLIALVSLPHMLRHQRATEASLAVQFGETRAALDAAARRDADMQASLDALRSDLAAAVEELSDRLTRTEQHAGSLGAHVAELHQLALTMNHWTVEVRKSIDAIETAEAERRGRADEAAATIIVRERALDAQRDARLNAWADELARRLPKAAAVLDLGGAPDWLAHLAARGFRIGSIETNSALHREARALRLDVTLGHPAELLTRIADASLDALTVSAPARVGAEMTPAELLGEAQRILRSGGVLLVDAGRRGPTEETYADLARHFAFADATMLDVFAGRALVFART